IAARTRDRPTALVVDDQPAAFGAIDAVDHAVQREAVNRGLELLLGVMRCAIETAVGAVRLQLREAVALEGLRPQRIRKRDRAPGFGVELPQAGGANFLTGTAELAGPAQRLVEDNALHGLSARGRRQPLLISIPQSTSTITIGLESTGSKINAPFTRVSER